MDPALAALIGALGGAAIGLFGAYRISASDRQDQYRRERRRAYGAYLGALYPAVSELRSMPPNRPPNALERVQGKFTDEQAVWMRTRKTMTEMAPQLFTRIDRLSLALAEVQVLDMSPEVMKVVEDANSYVERLGEERTEELKAKWSSIHDRLLAAKARL